MQLKPPMIKLTKINLKYLLDSVDQHSQQRLQINFYIKAIGTWKL